MQERRQRAWYPPVDVVASRPRKRVAGTRARHGLPHVARVVRGREGRCALHTPNELLRNVAHRVVGPQVGDEEGAEETHVVAVRLHGVARGHVAVKRTGQLRYGRGAPLRRARPPHSAVELRGIVHVLVHRVERPAVLEPGIDRRDVPRVQAGVRIAHEDDRGVCHGEKAYNVASAARERGVAHKARVRHGSELLHQPRAHVRCNVEPRFPPGEQVPDKPRVLHRATVVDGACSEDHEAHHPVRHGGLEHLELHAERRGHRHGRRRGASAGAQRRRMQ
mmetsp:Transcript_5897/g.19825  ORF Transcript_5897/g.19825 Transcript_5897/m.19825 type:complete len:278 (+) Transcript_5897:179-1012(+)